MDCITFLTINLAQVGQPGDVPVGESLFGGAVGAFFSTLVVAAVLVTFVPGYVERMIAALTDDPVPSFAVGFAAFLALVVVIVVLFITIVGILLAVPLLLVLWVAWAVGSAIAYLAVAERIVDRDDGWGVPVLVAAAISGVLAITGIGGLIGFCVGAAGFGAVLRDIL